MTNMHKAFWHSEDNSIKLSMPIAKIDKEKRTVSGFATLDNVDKQSDIVPTDVSIKAFERFRGNLREMHMPVAVGRVMSFKSDKFYDKDKDKFYNGVYVDAYISKGAQDTWEKVLDGTLSGFSIGGSIKDTEDQYDPEMDKSIRVIKDYDLHELSLVDNPANQFANIVSIQKAEDGQNTFDGIMTKMSLENVYWSKENSLVRLSKEEDIRSGETLIGFVETTDNEKNEVIKNLIKAYGTMTNENVPTKNPTTIKPKKKKKDDEEDMDKASNVKVGDMVSWNSSGGTARGKVTRVVRNGKIKVPNSSFTITGTPEDPAVAIRLYRDGKPTDTIVGHKMKTLRRVSMKSEQVSDNYNKEVNDMAKTEQEATVVAEEVQIEKTEVVEDELVVVDEIVKSDSDAPADAPAEAVAEDAPVEEVVAPVAPAEDAPAEDAPADVEKAETPAVESKDDDLAKAVQTVKVSVEEISKSVTAAVGDLAATVKSINEQLAELTKSVAKVTEEVTTVKSNVEEFGKRVDAVEDDTAIRKSGDLGGVVQGNKIKKGSMWGGRFLNTADLYR
jgi:Hypervirulence associated proteins TUDOR domain/Caudovirus prohead serine protease